MNDGAETERPRIETELREAGEASRLQQETSTHGPRFGKALEQMDVVAIARQERRRREPSDSGANDAYSQVPHERIPTCEKWTR
jgi:hypothetical protein